MLKSFDRIEKISRGRFHGIDSGEFKEFHKKYLKKPLSAIPIFSEYFIFLKECKKEYYYPKSWFVQYYDFSEKLNKILKI